MKRIPILLLLLLIFSCKETKTESRTTDSSSATENKDETIKTNSKDSLIFPEEKHFKSLQQVTFGGDNAEAYWSFDDQQLIFQSNNKKWGLECDQMSLMNAWSVFYFHYHYHLGTRRNNPLYNHSRTTVWNVIGIA